jgi:hypothetical protein
MAKILCEFDGKQYACKVIENLGCQGGDYAKAVEHNGEEKIVVKRGNVWRQKTPAEKLGLSGRICGQ